MESGDKTEKAIKVSKDVLELLRIVRDILSPIVIIAAFIALFKAGGE